MREGTPLGHGRCVVGVIMITRAVATCGGWAGGWGGRFGGGRGSIVGGGWGGR